MTIFLSILLILAAYLIGSIPTGLIIGNVFYNKNLHNEGSGGTGATNSVRILGKKAGAAVFLFDITKAALPALLAQFLKLPVNPAIIAFSAILGHCFPLFAEFKGGKAVATSFGFFAVFFPWPTTIGFFVFVATFILFDMISLSSILTASTIFLYMLTLSISTTTKLFVGFIWALLVYRHRSNIERIIKRNENKMVLRLKHKMILTAVAAAIIITSSLFTLSKPKDNAALRTLFDKEIVHLEKQIHDYETIAEKNPTPESYLNVYKSQVLHDAYALMTYDIFNTYSPEQQNDVSEKLVVEYAFSSRINLNAFGIQDVYEQYKKQYNNASNPESQKKILEEMKSYLLKAYPVSRTQGAPEKYISLEYTKVNNQWFLPPSEQITLLNYLNSDIFVNNFSTSYIGSDENALSQILNAKYKHIAQPAVNGKENLTQFADLYIQYLKDKSFADLIFTIDSSSQTTIAGIETMDVIYSFNNQSVIPVASIKSFITKKQAELDKLPESEKEKFLRDSKQELIATYKKQTKVLETPRRISISYSRPEQSTQWQLKAESFEQFKYQVTTYLLSEEVKKEA